MSPQTQRAIHLMTLFMRGTGTSPADFYEARRQLIASEMCTTSEQLPQKIASGEYCMGLPLTRKGRLSL
jgi:hypothetical protein